MTTRKTGARRRADREPLTPDADAVDREGEAFSRLTRAFADDPRVSLPASGSTRGRFGTNGLRVDQKIFAMWVAGALVVKLPSAEVDEAVAANHGSRLEMGKGRVMREWLVVDRPEREWLELAKRALRFVGSA